MITVHDIADTTTITQPPEDLVIEVNRTRFFHCIASYDPRLDVTYVWYENNVQIDFELVFRLGEDKYEMWYNPHFKRVRPHCFSIVISHSKKDQLIGPILCSEFNQKNSSFRAQITIQTHW